VLLRRVIQHVRNQEWTAIGIDFVIVVVGVFIGIQVSNWNQDRESRRVANEYIGRLQDDLRIEIQSFGRLADYYEKTRRHAISALEAYAHPADELGIDFLIDLYQASQLWNLTERRGTYEELLASGRIGLISKESMRSILNNYYESGAARSITLGRIYTAPYRKTIRTYMDERIQRLIREKCGDTYTQTANNGYYLQLPDICDIEVSNSVTATAIEALMANVEIRQDLRFQLAELDSILPSIKNSMNSAETALAELERETQ
jgi:hypothetical protein